MTATAFTGLVSFPPLGSLPWVQGHHRPAPRPPTPTSAAVSASSCVHAGRPRPEAGWAGLPLELGARVDCDPVDERGDDAGVGDLAGPAIEEVTIEHHEVRRLAGFDRSHLGLE